MQNATLTMKSWPTYNPAKSVVWNIIHMPKCSKCNKRYGSDSWNDDDNIRNNRERTNAPIKVVIFGIELYYCPECSSKIKG